MSSILPMATEFGSLRQAGLSKLDSLCDTLAVSASQRLEATQLFEEICGAWGNSAVGDTPCWPSDITDDGTPFEFSVAFENKRLELRMLFESQLRPLSTRSSWDAGIAFGQRLRRAGQADLALFDKVSDIFAPRTQNPARFSLWHAVAFRDQARLYKAYFNPELEDPSGAPARVDTALERLGLEHARSFVKACTKLPLFSTRLPYFSVDLERPELARAKIYCSAGSAAHAAAIVAETGGLAPAVCNEWLAALVGTTAPQRERPFLICAGFRRGSAKPDVTVHVPIRCFADNDGEAVERAASLLGATEAAQLHSVLKAISGAEPSTTSGVLTYASLRQTAEGVRVTGYFAPQLYTVPRAASSGTHSVRR